MDIYVKCFLPEHAVCLQREIKDAQGVKPAFLGSWLLHEAPLKALFKHLDVASPKDKVWWLAEHSKCYCVLSVQNKSMCFIGQNIPIPALVAGAFNAL